MSSGDVVDDRMLADGCTRPATAGGRRCASKSNLLRDPSSFADGGRRKVRCHFLPISSAGTDLIRLCPFADTRRILALDSAVWRSLCESHTDFAATAANVLMAMAEDSLATLSQPDAAEPRLRFLQQRLPAVIDALSAQLAQQRSSGGDPSWNDMKTMLGSLNNCFLAVQAAL